MPDSPIQIHTIMLDHRKYVDINDLRLWLMSDVLGASQECQKFLVKLDQELALFCVTNK